MQRKELATWMQTSEMAILDTFYVYLNLVYKGSINEEVITFLYIVKKEPLKCNTYSTIRIQNMKTFNTQNLVAQLDIWLRCPLIYVQTFSITVVCSTVKLLQFSPNTTPPTSLQLPWLAAGRERVLVVNSHGSSCSLQNPDCQQMGEEINPIITKLGFITVYPNHRRLDNSKYINVFGTVLSPCVVKD